MAMIRKTITLTEKQDDWIKGRIDSGNYGNDSEYIRDLVRRDQEAHARRDALRDAVREGLESGPSDLTLTGIWDRAEAGRKAPRG